MRGKPGYEASYVVRPYKPEVQVQVKPDCAMNMRDRNRPGETPRSPVSALPPGRPWTGHGIRARRTFALITFLSVTDVDMYTYARQSVQSISVAFERLRVAYPKCLSVWFQPYWLCACVSISPVLRQ